MTTRRRYRPPLMREIRFSPIDSPATRDDELPRNQDSRMMSGQAIESHTGDWRFV